MRGGLRLHVIKEDGDRPSEPGSSVRGWERVRLDFVNESKGWWGGGQLLTCPVRGLFVWGG